MSRPSTPFPADPAGVQRFRAPEIVGSPGAVWLLSVLLGGRFFRFSTRPVVVEDEDGVDYVFDGGLDPVDFAERVELFADEPELASASFSVVFPVDLAAWESRGVRLDTARGELSLWVPGSVFESRRVLLVGDVVGPSVGEDGEPVAFSVEADLYDDRALLPPSAAVVSSLTWSTAAESDLGRYYPEIIGSPGFYVEADGTTATAPGSPALVVVWDAVDEEADKLLIAGHEVEAASVTVYDAAGYSEVFSVTTEADGAGRRVSTVDLSTATASFNRAEGDFWVAWHNGGGRLAPSRESALEGAGDVVRYYLLRSTLNVDEGRLAAAVDTLNRYKIATYFDSPSSPWAMLKELVLPALPVSFVGGASGMYPIVWRFEATSADAVAHLVAGPGFVRRSNIERTRRRGEVVNKLRLSWGFDARQKTGRRLFVIGPQQASDEAAGEYRSTHATRSALRYSDHKGRPYVAEVEEELRAVCDPATVARVAGWKLREGAFIPREVEYEGSFEEYGWLERGDVVTLTDEAVHLDAAVASLASTQITATGSLVLVFEIRDDPVRDTNAAA